MDRRADQGPVERGGSEERSGAPLTGTERETSVRPASMPPDEVPDAHTFLRQKELNPDDFE